MLERERPNRSRRPGGKPAKAPPTPQKPKVDPVRLAALRALQQVTGDGAYANLVGPSMINRHGLTGRDAALATELINGTCRAIGTYELIIEAAARRDTRELDPDVVDVLCLGVHQLVATRIPAHAAISTSVDLARSVVGERVTGLVNAVLRKVSMRDLDAWLDLLTEDVDPTEALAIRTFHPRWIVDGYADVLPADELEPALRANNVAPSPVLVARPGLSTVDELVAEGAVAEGPSPYQATWQGNPGDLAMIRDGRAGVQDGGSQLVALALARAEAPPAGRWLDLCAGPGGKTSLLTGLAREVGASVVAVEPSTHRALLVAQAVAAHPAASVTVIQADGTEPAWRFGSFTRVLADVPCSGLGSLRRRPESRWRRHPDDVSDLTELQTTLLYGAIDALRHGGIVAYVTCSPLRAETDDVVATVVAERSDVEVVPATRLLPEVSDAASGDRRVRGAVQLWPHRHGTDAMYLALLRRR
ncbi:RsmB/NOP family class I SAM-dependent RNA methyltransferase [Propionibacteriaceae bacterium Y2011]